MLKLYGGARSRASIVRWYLEELGIPYEFVQLDMASGEHLRPPFTDINPLGKVPAILDGDFKLWESGAILLYLAEKYGKAPLTLEQRSLINQWILYSNATMGPGVFSETTREKEFPRHMTLLNGLLQQHPYMMGNDFSVVDVMVGSMVAYIPMMLQLDLSPYPAVMDYLKRLGDRPAFQKAIGGR
jgi:glutathione S-transferase